MPQDWEPANWAEEQAHRVSREVRRLREPQSTQWLSDRTDELGHRVSRAVIADLENGRRKYVTTVELTMLAAALNTAPIALLYPGPYSEPVEITPGFLADQLWAAQSFCGLIDGRGDAHREEVEAVNPVYANNIRRLRMAREVWELEMERIALMRAAQQSGAGDDDHWPGLKKVVVDIQQRIDQLNAELKKDYGREG